MQRNGLRKERKRGEEENSRQRTETRLYRELGKYMKEEGKGGGPG